MHYLCERALPSRTRTRDGGSAGLKRHTEAAALFDSPPQQTAIGAEAQGSAFATLGQRARTMLACLLLLAPYAILMAIRAAVGREVCLAGLLVLVGVLMLAGFGKAIAEASTVAGTCPGQPQKPAQPAPEQAESPPTVK